MKKSILYLGSVLLMSSVNATLLFEEEFDYGGSDITDIDNNLANYNGDTGTIDYIADVNLTGLGGESGGSLYYDFASSGSRNVQNTDAVLDPFSTASSGDTFWIAGLIEYNTLGSVTIRFENGETVNDWGFGIDSSGNVILIASDDGAVANSLDTGVDAAANGSTYTFLSRATMGAGGDSAKNSTVDFWFNRTDFSSVGALGGPDFTTGADSKIGRSTGSFSELQFGLGGSPFVRADEIRFGTELSDVATIPEPGTLALVGISLATLMVFRRRFR